MFDLTFTHLDTEAEYKAVYLELYGEEDSSPFDPAWSHSLSLEVTAQELSKLVAMISMMVPSVQLWQMRITPIEK